VCSAVRPYFITYLYLLPPKTSEIVSLRKRTVSLRNVYFPRTFRNRFIIRCFKKKESHDLSCQEKDFLFVSEDLDGAEVSSELRLDLIPKSVVVASGSLCRTCLRLKALFAPYLFTLFAQSKYRITVRFLAAACSSWTLFWCARALCMFYKIVTSNCTSFFNPVPCSSILFEV